MKAFLNDVIKMFKPDPRVIALQQLARANRWGFDARRKLSSKPDKLLPFELFKGNRGKRLVAVMNIKAAKPQANFRIYDYVYFGNLSTTSTTVFEYYDADLKLSPFTIFPKESIGPLKKIFTTPPSSPILATTPEFNERYQIKAQDHDAIKMDLSLNFLDEVGDEPGWSFEGQQHFLIAYKPGQLIDPSDIEKELNRFAKMAMALT